MHPPSLLLPFLAVVAVLTVTPGPDMVLVLRNGALGGTRAAWWTGLGCCTGIAGHAALAVGGLSALLAASAAAFTVVELVGAGYLVWLGAGALWRARRRQPTADHPGPAGPRNPVDRPGSGDQRDHHPRRRVHYRQGLLTNLLNPKIALLFLTLLPQFVAAGEPRVATTATLAGVFLVVAVLWWRLFSLAVGGLGGWLSRARVRTALDRATGLVLLCIGLRVALEHA